MRKFGLIGYPLGHSFSKKYFSEKFARENINDCYYDNYPLSDIGGLPELIESEPFLYGLNVTIPYKTDVMDYLGSIDEEARKIGAVNVIKIKRSGNSFRLFGYNTDVEGIRETLKPFIETNRIRNALILGTGGSSRAVYYLLTNEGVNVSFVSRTKKRGVLTYAELDDEIYAKTDLIVNTTPLGMYPEITGKPDLNYNKLNQNHILFDLVYNPELTTFLNIGITRGCTIITGLKMLYAQAEKSWQIWNDDKY